ncbi:MAG: capsular polysaccharide biosynthesis protein [Clostridiales bacterium]|nr:capsular polysaccharide biosynthesis protein [Clostridiales bacterium]
MATMAMQNEGRYYDLHSHILPGMDDGYRSCERSAEALRLSVEQGVAGMMATSHYYPKETVGRFLERREAAYQSLMAYLEKEGSPAPELCLGAEVAYHSGLIYEERLEELCLGASRYLLLEMPFSRWAPSVLRDVQAMRSVRGITPVIAHVERYWQMQDKRTMASLLDMDVLIQMNAEVFLAPRIRRMARKLLKQGVVQVMGSDTHNLDSRPPNLGLALQELESGRLAEYCEEVNRHSRRVFMAAQGKGEKRA